MIHTLAKRGLRRSPAQTPKEFADSLTGLPVQKGIAKFTEHYERARFGDSAEDARRLPELYAEVSTASRH
jgi:hypothetical protein